METVCHYVAFKWCLNGLNDHLGKQCEICIKVNHLMYFYCMVFK